MLTYGAWYSHSLAAKTPRKVRALSMFPRKKIDHLIVKHCAPTLLGVKPASLFTFTGSFSGSGTPLSVGGEAIPRSALLDAINETLASIDDDDIHIEVLAWRSFGAIVFMYRERLLSQTLSSPAVSLLLSDLGYHRPKHATSFSFLDHLKHRFIEERVPHEVGLFLGYPAEDVRGFIENRGHDYLLCGCWKVYANPRRAARLFSRYRRCTRKAQRLFRAGEPVGSIARLALLTTYQFNSA